MQIVRDITTIVAPSATLVTLADAKNYLKVDYSEDDALIQSLIDSAIKRLEQYAGSAFSPRTLKVVAYVDFFIEPPYAPINSITKVEYYSDNAWVEAVLDSDYYILGDTYKKVYMVTEIGRAHV